MSNFFETAKSKISEIFKKTPVAEISTREAPEAYVGGLSRPLFNIPFDGEKNTGELGDPVNYIIDYSSLRARSWKAYLDNRLAQSILNKYVKWSISTGLRLQSEPVSLILEQAGIQLDKENFTKEVETRFHLWAKQKWVDYAGVSNLRELSKELEKNAIVGGDVLVVLRVIKGNLKIQLIDGAHLSSPWNSSTINSVKGRGNRISHGIEFDSRGRHVAYWVLDVNLKHRRIRAYGAKTGRRLAFLYYGLKYRLDNVRGIPATVAVLETVSKLDRYQEAAVGGAEERAKIPYTIEHDSASDGENAIIETAAKAFDYDNPGSTIPKDVNGKTLSRNIAATTQKSVFNMPIGSKLKSLESKSEINFSDFYEPNAESICSTIDIPPEVAFSKYNSNYSASRASLKDWEHTLFVERLGISEGFLQIVYEEWLHLEILKNVINVPGYLTFYNDPMTLAAIGNARFEGTQVPQIDPVKEAKAERIKLGPKYNQVPLTTGDKSTKALGTGDYAENLDRNKVELQSAESAGIDINPNPYPNDNGDGEGEDTE